MDPVTHTLFGMAIGPDLLMIVGLSAVGHPSRDEDLVG